jgi:hypothetical protein
MLFQLEKDAAHAASGYRDLQVKSFGNKNLIAQRFYQNWYGFDELVIRELVDSQLDLLGSG